MTTHTPGPWTIRRAGALLLIDGAYRYICHIDQPDGVEREANARLIKAAPDLLAALKRMVAEFGDFPDPDDSDGLSALEIARRTIAEAEGRP